MDQDRFDDLARLLGAGATRRGGLRAALGGLLGVGIGAAALDAAARRSGAGKRKGRDADADRRRRRKRCKPACAAGQTCVRGTCVCDDGGTACGAACCLIGQACQGGQCVTLPEPGECVAAGEPCKNVGVPCCAGRVCASGQGGETDVACYVPKTGACATTADCVYGMSCQAGRCAPPSPAGLAQPCSQASQQLCTTPGAVCTPYTGPDAPAGTFCTLPLQRTCTGDPDCTCHKCWYTVATVNGTGRGGRISANTKACCHRTEEPCAVDQDCCLGLSCVNGVCGGTLCTPDNAAGCDADTPCCTDATCVAGTCIPCQGCLDAQQICQAGTTQVACGVGGVSCASCTAGLRCCAAGSCTAPTAFPEYNFPAPGPPPAVVEQPYDVVMTSDGLEAIASSFAGNNFAGNQLPVWTRPTTAPNTWVYRYSINLGGGTKQAWGLWLSADAKTLYVAEFASNKVTIWERPSVGTTNNWTQQANGSIDLGFQRAPTALVASPDQLTLYVALVDSDQGMRVYTRSAVGQPWSQQSSWSDPAVVQRPKGLAVSADGLTAWLGEGVAAGNEAHNIVILTRASTSASFTWSGGEIQTVLRQVRGLWLSPDELTLYVAAGEQSTGGKVQVWTRSSTAAQDWQMASAMPSGNLTYGTTSGGGVSATPDGAHILVAVPGPSKIYGFDPVCS